MLRQLCVLALVVLGSACTQTPSEDDATSGESSDDVSSSGSDSDSDTGAAAAWQTSLSAGQEYGAFMSVWGPSPQEVYAVGGQPEPSVAAIVRFDGASWTEESAPADTPMLNWVFGVDGQVWSVGQGGAIVTRSGDGSWSAELSPSDRVLWGLWGASADELWAVGGDGLSDTPVLLRRDGLSASWEQVTVPEPGNDCRGLFKVWGTGAADIWVVGDNGATLHWDGGEWTAHPTDGGVDLISLWGSPAEGIVAVGGRASGRIARLSGDSWSETVLDLPGLNGVWVDPQGPVTAVGVQGKILAVSPGGFDYVEEDSGTSMVLHSVFGFAGGPRFAVGGSLLMPPPFIGVILRSES